MIQQSYSWAQIQKKRKLPTQNNTRAPETTLGVQGLRHHTPKARGPGLILGQGTRSCKLLLFIAASEKILQAATETQRSQINKRYMHPNVHSSSIYNSQDMKAT